MKLCKHCKNFAEEEKKMEMTQLQIMTSFYNYDCPINYCPNCGNNIKEIKKYANKTLDKRSRK